MKLATKYASLFSGLTLAAALVGCGETTEEKKDDAAMKSAESGAMKGTGTMPPVSPGTDAPKTDTTAPTPPPLDAPKIDAPKTDAAAPPAEAPKADAPKVEAPAPATAPPAEAPKTEAPKA